MSPSLGLASAGPVPVSPLFQLSPGLGIQNCIRGMWSLFQKQALSQEGEGGSLLANSRVA